jgi:hypothetical protein
LYTCSKTGNRNQYFVTIDSKCEGQVSTAELLGYVRKASAAGHKILYRCLAGQGDHFVSEDVKCEGQKSEGGLGYFSTTAFK